MSKFYSDSFKKEEMIQDIKKNCEMRCFNRIRDLSANAKAKSPFPVTILINFVN
jgi:hypothetical protein